MKYLALLILSMFYITGCQEGTVSQEVKDKRAVQAQQSQYAKSQPVPAYNWSLERHMVTQLYNIRNLEATTHSVWRSDRGIVEGDCTSIGFGVPYDTSLTNPLQGIEISASGEGSNPAVAIEQAEPNGIFASKNTNATWVMCAGNGGSIEPVYVETKVTVYPYPVNVDYETNRVKKTGKATVTINSKK